jgi:(1->4)-alpha-D-glucan 1-alpha-D-glucosylmutase
MLATLPLYENDRKKWLVSAADQLTDGTLKLFVTACLARIVSNAQDFFRQASYVGLAVEGDRENHVVAFARYFGTRMTVVAVGRLLMALSKEEQLPIGHEIWGGSRIRLPGNTPPPQFTDVLSGNRVNVENCDNGWFIPAAETFYSLPIAVLVGGV